ncbi:ABC transporter substrate-binding protein [Burkholderia latens]|uniref:ABC transporter substrate-binding protein n=1 Tax=Burkholderia latens TaxID=488446 RepID=A0AAP1C929_9BURK|nr:transporter substrate-binding domain-containing protein [Burkholderia latens]KVA10692.1 ABC transporter substrate-binding protein [Burkholderia latens]
MNWNAKLLIGLATAMSFTTAGAQTPQVLRMGLNPTYPPFESKSSSGELQGFDIDVGNAICKKLNVKCIWIENDFDGLIPALQARKFDVINSAMNITEKRKQIIDFTSPIYVVPIQLVARKSANLQATSASMNGKTVGVMRGTTQEAYLQKHWANTGTQVVTYEDQAQVFADLVAGRIDGAVQESQTALDGLLNKPEGRDFAFVGAPLVDPATLGVGTGLGMRKGGDALRGKVQSAIAALKQDGTLSALSQKYFKRDIIAKN